eukprot:gene18217-20035_t
MKRMVKGVGSVKVQNDEELDIEAEIQKELEALDIEEDLDVVESGVGPLLYTESSDVDIEIEKDVEKYTSDVDEYLKIIQTDEQKTKQNLQETEEILLKSENHLNSGIEELLKKKLRLELGSSRDALNDEGLLKLRSEVFAEIEEQELEEEKEFAKTSSQELNNLAVVVIRPDLIEEIERFEEEEKAKLKELREIQKEEEQYREEMVKKRKEEELLLEREAEERSMSRLEALEKAMVKFEECEKEMSMKSEEETLIIKKLEDEFEKEMKERSEQQRLEEERLEKGKIEKEKLEKKRFEKEKREKERLEKEKLEKERLEKERLEKENLEKEKLEKERTEKERLEKERLEKERLEKERLEKERLEKEKLEKERLEKERLEMERLEKERLEKEKLEKERLEKGRLEKENLEKEKLEKERTEKERLEKERLEKERLEKERLEKERLEKEKLEKERLEKERLEMERLEKERLEKEKLEKERLEKGRLEKEKLEKERLEKERTEKERLEKERLEKERLEKERLEKERLEKEKFEKERTEKERLEKEKVEKERLEKERLEKERLEKERLKKERLEKEKIEKERVEKEKFEKEKLEKQKLEKESLQRKKLKKEEQEMERLDQTKEHDINSSLPASIETMRQEWTNSHLTFSQSTEDSRVQPVSRSKPRTSYRRLGTSSLPDLTDKQILATSFNGASLNTIQCIFVTDLDGVGMKSLSDCPNLRAICMENCKIETFEGIDNCQQLQMVNLCRNRVSSLLVSSIDSLRIVLLSENNLSSVNGLEVLANLEVLDLSMNRITRIGSLTLCRKLQDLDLSGNQLISLKGVEGLNNLLSLKAARNHLSSAKEIECLSLLVLVDLAGNTIQSVPNLKNHVLLRKLQLDENNITTLGILSDCWLPSLEILTLSGNSIEELPSLDHLLMLDTLDLRDNLIKEFQHLLNGITKCRRLTQLLISGNPVESTPNMRSHIESALSSLKILDKTLLNESQLSKEVGGSLFENLCLKQKLESSDLSKSHAHDIKSSSDVGSAYDRELKKLKTEELFLKSKFNLALRHLHEHETFGVVDAVSWDQRFFDEEKTEESETRFQSDMKVELRDPESTGEPKDVGVDKLSVGSSQQEETPSWSDHHIAAAIKIQALYRGYILRRAFFAAMTSARYQGKALDDDEFDYDEEVDLSAFDFEDETQDWKPRTVPDDVTRRAAWNSQPATPDPSPHPVEPLNLDFSPEESEATITNTESRAGSKQDDILVEWGLQNTSTVDLMLKRARRMKAASRRHDMMTPDKRYALFKKMQKHDPNMIIKPPAKKRTRERVEYFAAQREAGSSTRMSNVSSDGDYKKEMMYSWICNQTVLHTDTHQDIIKNQPGDAKPKSDKKPSFTQNKEGISLPYMDPAIIAGKNVPLVLLSSRDHAASISAESSIHRKGSIDSHVKDHRSTGKSRSAPDPCIRTAHTYSCNNTTTASSRSSSSDSNRGKAKSNRYKK